MVREVARVVFPAALAGTLMMLVSTSVLLAQPLSNFPDDNLGGENLEPAAGQSEPTTPAGGESAAPPSRRIQRLGDVLSENEYELELTVPQGVGSLPNAAHLPDAEQQKQLQSLLSQLADEPGNKATLRRLDALLLDVMRQANAAIDSNNPELARQLLGVVQAVNPGHSQIAPSLQRLQQLGEIEGQLQAARKAFEEGRVDEPEGNNAWHFYRQVLEQAPDNEAALLGLVAVQQDLITRAKEFAHESDFDSADRLLEDAALVREDQQAVEQAQHEIDELKRSQAESMETRAVMAMDSGDFATAERILIDLVAMGGSSQAVTQLRRRLEEARVYGGFKPGQKIRDHFLTEGIWAPESVVILAGSFMMGSSADEKGRAENEGPQHRVTFRRGFAIGQREISVEEFRIFVHKTGYKTDAERKGYSTIYDQYSGRLTRKDDVDWQMDFEGRTAKPEEPVIHVSWNDAQAYVDWLARGTGKPYRLPSEAEFEYALRGGRSTPYWWGNGTPGDKVENITGSGDSSRSRRSWTVAFEGYTDRYWGPAPVASFEANPFGLYDIGGNVGEWVRDCWHDTYVRAPVDGSAWVNPGCEQRVIRGGYWASAPDQTRSAYRLFARQNHHDARIGFRIARDL